MIPEEEYGTWGWARDLKAEPEHWCRVCGDFFADEHDIEEEYELGKGQPVLSYCTVTGRMIDENEFAMPSQADMDYVYKSLGVER